MPLLLEWPLPRPHEAGGELRPCIFDLDSSSRESSFSPYELERIFSASRIHISPICYPNGGVSYILSFLYPMGASLSLATSIRSATPKYPETAGNHVGAEAQSMLELQETPSTMPGVHVYSA